MITSLECNKLWYRPDKMAGLGRLSWKQSTSRWKKPSLKSGAGLRLLPSRRPPLFSSHQQSKRTHRLTTAGDSSPCELADKLKLGQPPWRRSSGDLPGHELTVHEGYLCFQALLPDSSPREPLASPAAHADLALDELTSGRKRTTFPSVASAKAKGQLVPGLGCAWKDGGSSLAALCTR